MTALSPRPFTAMVAKNGEQRFLILKRNFGLRGERCERCGENAVVGTSSKL
jgi:hypothetical protein